MRTIGARHSPTELRVASPTRSLPISIAYVVAHYFSLLVLPARLTCTSSRTRSATGANIFGTANFTLNYAILTGLVWYVQVVALLLGHVCGLALAHDRALVLYRRPRDAMRSQYWMLTVMVAFTSLGLWLLSAAE